MPRYDLVVIGDLVTPAGVLRGGGLGVRDGRVVDVWPAGTSTPTATQTLDARDCWVLPGAIDAHVHCFSAPQEGFLHATRAAAAGGVTTILEMPYDAGAPVNTRAVLDRKIERLEREAVVDVALLGTIRKTGGLDQIEPLAAGGVCGFKLSLYETDPERFPKIEDGELLEAFRRIRDVGLRVGVHAEDGAIIDPRVAAYRAAGQTYPRAHCETRPPVSETAAVAVALELAADAGVAFHVFHASLPRTFELVERYRQHGLRATAETCPHYLLLDETDMDHLAGRGKINPPLRSAEAVAGLWDLMARDVVDLVASDHAPWPADKKDNRQDIFANASGTPGVETLLPLVYGEGVARGRISIQQSAALLSERPARAFGLWPRKGQIAAGADADLVVLDPRGSRPLRGADLQSTAGWTPYEGRALAGRITRSLVRGRVVYDGETVTGQPGDGHFVRPGG